MVADSASEPNAVPVVSAEKITARAVADASRRMQRRAPVHHEVDVERHADAQQQRQCDDVGEVQRQRAAPGTPPPSAARTAAAPPTPARRPGSRRNDANRMIAIMTMAAIAALRNAAMMVRAVAMMVTAELAGLRHHGAHLVHEGDQAGAAAGLRLRRHLRPGPPVRQHPVARDVRGHGRHRGRPGGQRQPQIVQLARQKAGERRVGRQQRRVRPGRQLAQIGPPPAPGGCPAAASRRPG